MPELIGIFDGGSTIIHISGQPYNVGVVVFRASVDEAAPVDFIAYCRLVYKDSIIKNLKRLAWQKLKPPKIDVTQHRPKIDQAEYVEALESINNAIPV